MTSLEILALRNLPGYGPITVRKIVESGGNEKVKSAQELLDLVNSYEASKKNPVFKSVEEINHALGKAEDLLLNSDKHGIKTVTFLDDDFPNNLLGTINEKGRPDIPLVLFYKGDLRITCRKSIAIIGTKDPTEEGLEAAFQYGKLFSDSGFNVISRVYNGCDSYAMEGALHNMGSTSNMGSAIAILDHGLDIIEREENAQLAQETIAKGGLLISKYPIGERASRCSLLATDRLLGAFADAVLVIQSPKKGSTMYVARAALKAKRPVFCVEYKGLEICEKALGNDLLVMEGALYLESDKNPVEQVHAKINKQF